MLESDNVSMTETDSQDTAMSDLATQRVLTSLNEVCFYPEKFAAFCETWNAYSDILTGRPEKEECLNAIYSFAQQAIEKSRIEFASNQSGHFDSTFSKEVSFVVDSDGVVTSATLEAAAFLNISIGDSVHHLIADKTDLCAHIKSEQADQKYFIDIIAPNETRYMSSIERVKRATGEKGAFLFVLDRLRFSESVKKYLCEAMHLTKSEMNILELIVQRHNIDEVSKVKSISVNTVRTHINRIIKKFSKNSIADVALSTLEIVFLDEKTNPRQIDTDGFTYSLPENAFIQSLNNNNLIEYRCFNAAHKKNLVVLHSLTYGFVPSESFVRLADELGYAVYCLNRPGFGVSTPADSISDSAKILSEFIDAKNLDAVTLVSLSTAVPIALRLNKLSSRVSRLLAVNYAFNVNDALASSEPPWVQGMIDLSNRSQSSQAFAAVAAKFMIQKIGATRFFEKLYAGSEQDLSFVQDNASQMVLELNAILSSHQKSINQEMLSAFVSDPDLDELMHGTRNVTTVFGEYAYSLPFHQIRLETERYGMPLHILKGTGRYCIYQRPDRFFNLLDSLD